MRCTLLLLAFATTCTISFSQEIGSKVIFKSTEGSYYTGTVAEISNGKYRVVYDNTDFETWMAANQFSIAANPSHFTSYKNAGGATATTTTEQPRKSNNAIPTENDITTEMKKMWEKKETSLDPRTTVTINSIVIGTSAKANYAQELEGIPKNAMVTSAKIDFTQNKFYTNETQKVRRIMTAWVYRNQFNEWTVMNIGTVYPDK